MMIPQDFGFKLKSFLYSLAIFTVLSIALYSQRVNLANGVIAFLESQPFWNLINKWQFTEWLSHFIWGPLALSIAVLFTRFRSNRHKSEAPNVFNENALILNRRIETFTDKIDTLNENICTFFRFFNPHMTANGISFDFDETSRIILRGAEMSVDESKRLSKHLEKEAKRIKEKEFKLRKKEAVLDEKLKEIKKKEKKEVK